eukprot:tig00020629_g12428.t1
MIRTSPRPRRVFARPAVVSWVAARVLQLRRALDAVAPPPRAQEGPAGAHRFDPRTVARTLRRRPLSLRTGRRFPRVLFCDAATIASRIAWLRSRGLWRQCPQTLTLSEENLERKWAALSREIGVDGARRSPPALTPLPGPSQSKRRARRRVFEETIAPTLSVENLLGKLDEVQGALGVPRRELAALAARMPGLLEADVPARAGASFEYLGSLGLSRAEAAAVLRAVPRLLVSDTDACYSPAVRPGAPAPLHSPGTPRVSFLLSTGFSPSDVALLIRRRPTLHRFSVTKNYSPLVMFLWRQGIHGPALVRVLASPPSSRGPPSAPPTRSKKPPSSSGYK